MYKELIAATAGFRIWSDGVPRQLIPLDASGARVSKASDIRNFWMGVTDRGKTKDLVVSSGRAMMDSIIAASAEVKGTFAGSYTSPGSVSVMSNASATVIAYLVTARYLDKLKNRPALEFSSTRYGVISPNATFNATDPLEPFLISSDRFLIPIPPTDDGVRFLYVPAYEIGNVQASAVQTPAITIGGVTNAQGLVAEQATNIARFPTADHFGRTFDPLRNGLRIIPGAAPTTVDFRFFGSNPTTPGVPVTLALPIAPAAIKAALDGSPDMIARGTSTVQPDGSVTYDMTDKASLVTAEVTLLPTDWQLIKTNYSVQQINSFPEAVYSQYGAYPVTGRILSFPDGVNYVIDVTAITVGSDDGNLVAEMLDATWL